MAVSSEKKFFLDKLIRENNIDICEVLKTNIDYELAGSHNYHLFTHENINVSNEPMTKEDVLNLYKMAYDSWYDFIVNLDENKFSGRTLECIRKLKQNGKFKKENMSPYDCQRFIYKTYDEEFKESGLRFLNAQNEDDPVYNNNVYPDFVHVYTHLLPRGKNIDCRLYLNLQPQNIIPTLKLFLSECDKNNLSTYFKFDTGFCHRNDNIVIYASYRNVQKYVDILNKIKKENPGLFVGAEKGNPILPQIDGYIGFGEEPKYAHSSYNDERAKAVDEFFRDFSKKEIKRIGNYTGIIKNSYGENLDLRQYLKYRLVESFKETLDNHQRDILSRNYPHRYKTNEQIRAYIEIESNIYNKCRNSIPPFLDKQFDEKVDMILKDMQEGKLPHSVSVMFKTQRAELSMFSKEYTEDVLKKNGSINYSFNLDLDLKEKLFNVFGVKENALNYITKENLKPYFDKHHVSIDNIFLNTETEMELQSREKSK